MAKKRKSRRKTPLSKPVSRKVKRGRRRRLSSGRGKIGLSEMFNPAQAAHTGKGMFKSALTGYAIASAEPMMESLPEIAQNGILLVSSFIAGAVMKADVISNGISTVFGYRLAKKMQGMSEADWADEDSLNENDEYLDEDGNPLVLADDGNFYRLNEDGDMMDEDEMMGEGPVYLADDQEMYPDYINTSNY